MGVSRHLIRLTVGALAALPTPGLSQEAESQPFTYIEAQDLLEAGDTTAALRVLREITRAYPEFGPAHLRLGAVLVRRSSWAETDYATRIEAKRELERALRLMGDDPEVLLEYGLLLRRQHIQTDAKRVLERAWKRAEREDRRLAAELRAEFHYNLAGIYETWWEDWDELVMIPPTAEPVTCAAAPNPIGHAERSVLCPAAWAEQYEHVVPLADVKADERDRMMEHYRLALAADPGRVDAATRLLGHLAEGSEWIEYLGIARQLVRAAPNDPRSFLFLGLGRHETGFDTSADSAFWRALALMPERERGVFGDVGLLLTREGRELYASLDSAGRGRAADAFFASTDPLFLTEPEERRLEHYARLAWAELKFSEPATRKRGWDSERGQIWVRYGKPWRSYQCCYGGGGRHAYWSYGPQGPVFVFDRKLTYGHARLSETAKLVADDLAAHAPQFYQPVSVTAVYAVPHQLVRFRGRGPDLTRVEIYAAIPIDSLGVRRGGSLETGLFLFDPNYRELLARRLLASVEQERTGLTYVFEVAADEYRYAIEARESGPENVARPAARTREALSVAGFPDDRLGVSDLLLADALRPLAERPERREELGIVPSRTLRFRRGEPVHVYFEVYGLETDSEGVARYRVEFAVEDAEERNLVQRIARGVVELFSGTGDQEPRVVWERTVRLTGDRSIEYISVGLPPLDEGTYRMRLQVTDLSSGGVAGSERVLWMQDGLR